MIRQDVAAIVMVVAVFLAYLHYITEIYPSNCADACEREYYSGPEHTSYIETAAVELDPGDEQPLKRG